VLFGVANVDAHGLVPVIGDRRKPRIKTLAQTGDDVGQRIVEILVLATPETVPRHPHLAAEKVILWIQRRQRLAFLFGK